MFVCGALPPAKPICGVSDTLAKLAKKLLEKGLQVSIVTNVQSQTPVVGSSGEEAALFPVMKGWGFGEIPKFLTALKKSKPDIVHIQYPTQGYGRSWMPYFLPLILRLLGKQVVQTWHEHTRYRFFPNALTADNLIVVVPDFLKIVRFRYRWLVRRKNIHFIQIISNIPAVQLLEDERERIRSRWLINGSNLIIFFGFVYPGKGLESVFQISDPAEDTVVIIGQMDFDNNKYHQTFLPTINGRRWNGKTLVTGFMNDIDVAKLMAAADAVLCPFNNGLRRNNGTFLAALAQGTFVLTTTKQVSRYDKFENVYYCKPNGIDEMRVALKKYKGVKLIGGTPHVVDWDRFTNDHRLVYQAAKLGLKIPDRNYV